MVPITSGSVTSARDLEDHASLSSGVSQVEPLDAPCLTDTSALAPLVDTSFTPVVIESSGLSLLRSCYSPSATSEAAADDGHEI